MGQFRQLKKINKNSKNIFKKHLTKNVCYIIIYKRCVEITLR